MNSQDEIEARQAVNQAVSFVLSHPTTGSAAAMARVLLHAYNHHEQPLDITDLCLLDDHREPIAWAILKARVSGIEPHELASDKAAFDQIVKTYWRNCEG